MPVVSMKKKEALDQLTKQIFDKIGMKNGKLPAGYEVFGNRVLLATYEPPEKTKGGIFLTDQHRDNEKNIGKGCLVLAKGPSAFVDDDNYSFHGQNVEVGQWVSIWVYEARPMQVAGHPCRLVKDSDIQLLIPTPDAVL